MTMTTAEAIIIPQGTSITFGGTEAQPTENGVGAVVGPFADYGGTFSYRITNGGTAPGAPLTIVFYGVRQGRLYEVDRAFGSTVANDSQSGVIRMPVGFPQFTAKAFGNTLQNVSVEVSLQRQVP